MMAITYSGALKGRANLVPNNLARPFRASAHIPLVPTAPSELRRGLGWDTPNDVVKKPFGFHISIPRSVLRPVK